MQMLLKVVMNLVFKKASRFLMEKSKNFQLSMQKFLILVGEILILKTSKLTKNFNTDDNFYFVHSYFAEITKTNSEFVLSTSNYYDENFISSIEKDNVYGFSISSRKKRRFWYEIL